MSEKEKVVGEDTTTTAFSYDALDRTASIGSTTFVYDCDGDRIAKNNTETVWNNGEISANLTGNDVKVFTEDNSVYCENGTFTFNAIDSKGDVVATTSSYYGDYTYDAWGNDLFNTNTTNPIRYRGYYYDTETGLYYLKARYYDSTTGQFTQEDTVQDDNLQYNLYGYCSGNPVLYVDTSGHDAIFLNNRNGAKTFGHSALLIRYKKKWYYFSLGGKVGYDLLKLGKMKSLSIKSINNRIKKFKKRKYRDSYTEKYYVKGDFSNSYKFAKKIKNKKDYNVRTNNCLQVACKVILKGKFKGKYSNKIKDAFVCASMSLTPNDASIGLSFFFNTYKSYYSAKWYSQLFMSSPYSQF